MQEDPKGPVPLFLEDIDKVTGGGGGPQDFNYQQIADSLGSQGASIGPNLQSFTQSMDGGTADMIALQNMTQQWSQAQGLQSDTIKMIGDALHNLVKKVG